MKIIIYQRTNVRPHRDPEVFFASNRKEWGRIILHLFNRSDDGDIKKEFKRVESDKNRLEKITPRIIKMLPQDLGEAVIRRQKAHREEHWGYCEARRRYTLYLNAKKGHVRSAYDLLKKQSGYGHGYRLTVHTGIGCEDYFRRLEIEKRIVEEARQRAIAEHHRLFVEPRERQGNDDSMKHLKVFKTAVEKHLS